jgi:hypothetical protein
MPITEHMWGPEITHPSGINRRIHQRLPQHLASRFLNRLRAEHFEDREPALVSEFPHLNITNKSIANLCQLLPKRVLLCFIFGFKVPHHSFRDIRLNWIKVSKVHLHSKHFSFSFIACSLGWTVSSIRRRRPAACGKNSRTFDGNCQLSICDP